MYQLLFTGNDNSRAVNYEVCYGIEKFIELKKQFPNLTIDQFEPHSIIYNWTVSFHPTEQQLIRIPHFKNDCVVRVNVPEKGLNPFIYEELHIQYHKYIRFLFIEIKKICRIEFELNLDLEKILNAWEADGFPLDWNVQPIGEENVNLSKM